MSAHIDRRTFLRLAGLSLGAGALWRVGGFAGAEGADAADALRRANGEAPRPFSFVQLSDTHVGLAGPLNPEGTRAFERAVAEVNALPERPDLVLFTGDLSHESERPGEHAARLRRFREIAGGLRVPAIHLVPGEHDAGLDGGELFRGFFGETSYAFDHRGVHFVALDNVSRPKPEVGPERREWLRRDLARFPPTAPIVVFTHRPLFDLRPDWEWFTRDGAEVMAILAPFENVTVLYGHIHREDVHRAGHATHYAARALCFAFPDPAASAEKRPIPFDPAHPFRNLGLRRLEARRGPGARLEVAPTEVELTLRKLSGTEGFAQLLRPSSL